MTVLPNYVQTISCHLLSVLIEGEITDLDGNNKVPNPSPPPPNTHTQSYSTFVEIRATQTMKTNQMAELKQKIPTFRNPANQVSGRKQ